MGKGMTGGAVRVDPVVAAHFYIMDAASPSAVFAEISGLEVSLEVQTWEEGGTNDHVHRLPGRATISDITLKNGVTTGNDLWKWISDVLQGTFNRKNVSIVLVDSKGQTVQRWEFIKALPVKWSGPQLRSDQNAVAIQSLVLAHQGLILTTAR